MGNVRFVKSSPKNPPIIFNIKYARKTITSPTIAATIVFRAPSTAVLSPPDIIHFTPPKIRNPKAMTVAITNSTWITVLTIFPKLPVVKLQRTLN